MCAFHGNGVAGAAVFPIRIASYDASQTLRASWLSSGERNGWAVSFDCVSGGIRQNAEKST